MNFAIKAFEERFPLALTEVETYLASDLVLLTDDSFSSKEFRTELRRNFRVQSIDNRSPIDQEDSMIELKANDLATLMLVLTSKNLHQLKAIEKSLPGFRSVLEKIKKGDRQMGLFTIGSRKIIIVILQNPEESLKAISWMRTQKRVDKSQEFIKMELQ